MPPTRPISCHGIGDALRPTETIFYFDAGNPSGVSLANHDDHVHVGYNAF